MVRQWSVSSLPTIESDSMTVQADSTALSSKAGNLQKFLELDQKGKIIAEYIWIDSVGHVRSKSKVCVAPLTSGGN